MVELSKKITTENEDRVKDMNERIIELNGFCNVLYSAATNDRESVEKEDLLNAIYLLGEHVESLKNDMKNYIEFSEKSELFGKITYIKTE